MIRHLSSIIYLLSVLTALAAPSITLEWGPSPDADVNNYRLYWGPGSGNYTNSHDLGNVTNTVFTNIIGGAHYYFVVTAMNVEGAESDPSNEVDFKIPVTPPKQLRIVQTLQASGSPAGPWHEVATLNSLLDASTNSAFYRVRMDVTPPMP